MRFFRTKVDIQATLEALESEILLTQSGNSRTEAQGIVDVSALAWTKPTLALTDLHNHGTGRHYVAKSRETNKKPPASIIFNVTLHISAFGFPCFIGMIQ